MKKHLLHNFFRKRSLSKQKIAFKNLARTIFLQDREIEQLNTIKKYIKRNFDEINEYEFELPDIKIDKSKKVALCLSGFLRTFEKTSNALIKNIVEPYNADVIIFTPTQEDYKSEKLITEKRFQEIFGKNLKALKLWSYDEAEFRNLVKKHNLKGDVKGSNPINNLSAFYQLKECGRLKQEYEKTHDFKYDYVIKTRADLATFSILNLNKLDELEKTIYYPQYTGFNKDGYRAMLIPQVFPYRNIERGEYIGSGEIVFNDYISISNSKNYDKMVKLYDNYIEYYNRGILPNAETMMAYHLIFGSNLKIKMNDFITCDLHRYNSVEKWNPYLANNKWGYADKFK